MFKILIEGKTIKELKANIEQFIKESEVLQPSFKVNPVQPIIEKTTAALPEVPIDIAPARSIPTAIVAPPAVSSVPAAPTPSVPSNDYGVDSRGLPWDERIHSVSQGKNKDGSWRYKRGAEESTINSVEAELASKMKGVQAAQMEAPSPAIPQPAPISQQVVAPPIPAPSMSHLSAVPTPAAVVAPPPPMPPPQPAVPSAHTLETFKATLIPTLAKLVKDGKLTHEYQKLLCDHYGVDMLFKVNDDQLAEVFEGFVQYGMIVKA